MIEIVMIEPRAVKAETGEIKRGELRGGRREEENDGDERRKEEVRVWRRKELLQRKPSPQMWIWAM